jgi:hypothetical protein
MRDCCVTSRLVQGSLRTVERVITARNEKRHHHHHWMSPTIISNGLVR